MKGLGKFTVGMTFGIVGGILIAANWQKMTALFAALCL